MVVSEDGYLWVRRPIDQPDLTEHGSIAAVYDVFAADGRYLGSMPAPVGGDPKPHITDQYLVGVQRDSLDVPYVEVYRIIKPGR